MWCFTLPRRALNRYVDRAKKKAGSIIGIRDVRSNSEKSPTTSGRSECVSTSRYILKMRVTSEKTNESFSSPNNACAAFSILRENQFDYSHHADILNPNRGSWYHDQVSFHHSFHLILVLILLCQLSEIWLYQLDIMSRGYILKIRGTRANTILGCYCVLTK